MRADGIMFIENKERKIRMSERLAIFTKQEYKKIKNRIPEKYYSVYKTRDYKGRILYTIYGEKKEKYPWNY